MLPGELYTQNGTDPLLAHQNISIGLRGRGRKKGAEALAAWDWEAQRAKVARVLCSVSEVDLAPLFAPAPVEDAFLQLWMKFVRLHPDCVTAHCWDLSNSLCKS